MSPIMSPALMFFMFLFHACWYCWWYEIQTWYCFIFFIISTSPAKTKSDNEFIQLESILNHSFYNHLTVISCHNPFSCHKFQTSQWQKTRAGTPPFSPAQHRSCFFQKTGRQAFTLLLEAVFMWSNISKIAPPVDLFCVLYVLNKRKLDIGSKKKWNKTASWCITEIMVHTHFHVKEIHGPHLNPTDLLRGF